MPGAGRDAKSGLIIVPRWRATDWGALERGCHASDRVIPDVELRCFAGATSDGKNKHAGPRAAPVVSEELVAAGWTSDATGEHWKPQLANIPPAPQIPANWSTSAALRGRGPKAVENMTCK